MRNTIETKILKGTKLKTAVNKHLSDVLNAGEKRNAELINEYQKIFFEEESLLGKFAEIEPNMDFDYIKEEGVNLALLLDDNWMRDFKSCLDKITNDGVKAAFMQKIFDKVQGEIGSGAPYDNFSTECALPGNTNVISYFQTVVDYLTGKEGASHGKKTTDILKNIFISNEDINSALSAGEQIPMGTPLESSAISQDIRNAFDALLSFEIGKEADRAIDIAEDISDKLGGLFVNSLPAINTIVGEDAVLKYDESRLGEEYKGELEVINNDTSLEDDERDKKINILRRKYYLQYLKSENKTIGETLQQLYDNDFDYSKIDTPALESYLDKVTDIRLRMLFTSRANEILKINFGNYDEFSDFYKKLANPSENSIQLRPGIDLPVEKRIVEGKNLWLKDISEFGREAKSFDALPITYKIKETDINNLPLDIEDKIKLLYFLKKYKTDGEDYVIEGEDVGMLIYLFFLVNSRTPITSFDLDKQEDIERLFGEAKNNDKSGGSDKDEGEDGEDNDNEGNNNEGEDSPENNDEGNEELTPEDFKEKVEEEFGQKKIEFKDGAELWFPYGKSILPGGGYQRMKIKISDVDIEKGTFTGTFFGGELEFSKIEGKSKKFNMNKRTLDYLKNAAKEGCGDSDKVYLLPDPEKSSFNSFRDSLGDLGTTVFSFPVSGVTWDGNRFIQKIIDEDGKEKEVQVKYFGASADDKATYKIDYHPLSRTFTVYSSFNGEEIGKDGKTEKTRLGYKRDMDWNNFLIFFTQKGLYPQTENEANHAIMRQDEEVKIANGGRRKLNWFSINNVKHGFKDIFGALKKGMDDYNKKQDEKFRNLVEERTLNILGAFPLLPPALRSAIGGRKQDIYNERNNAARQEIEGYLKTYQSDPDFATTFEKVPPFSKDLLGGQSYKNFLLNLKDSNKRSESDVRKAAALLLANIEKGKSPYRGLVGWENKGYWVKTLLGEAHYNRFMSDKERCLNKIKNAGKDKVQFQDILASAEMDYIINNVRGNPDPEFFGSHETPGNDANPDNASKRLLSIQFADKLDDLKKDWFTASSVENQFNSMKHNDFNLAKKTFEKNIKSARYPSANAALKKMFTLACDKDQILMYKRCFLIYLLSGVLDVNCRKDLGKQAYLWGKTLGFPPALLAKNKGHPEQVVALLDHFSRNNPSNKFSNRVKSYFHNSSALQGSPNVENLITDFDTRWKENDNANQFCKYLKGEFLITKDFQTGNLGMDKTLKDLQKTARDQSNESGDNSLFCNATCINDAGVLAAPDTVHNRMLTNSEGSFAGETGDEKEDRAKFFNQCAEEISAMTVNQEYTNLLMDRFLGWFGLTAIETKNEIYKRIATASHYKAKIKKHKGTYHPSEKRKVKIKGENEEKIMYVPLGNITDEDVKKILRYGLEGRAWRQQKHCQQIPQALKNCFDAFQNYFQEAFNKGFLNSQSIKSEVFNIKDSSEREQHYWLGGWDVYRKIKKRDNDPFTVIGEDVISGSDFGRLSDKEKKDLWRPIFSRDNYLNDDMNEMEKQFKRNGCTVPTLAGDINEYEDLQVEYLEAA